MLYQAGPLTFCCIVEGIYLGFVPSASVGSSGKAVYKLASSFSPALLPPFFSGLASSSGLVQTEMKKLVFIISKRLASS